MQHAQAKRRTLRRVLGEAGGGALLIAAVTANLAEGYGKSRIASDAGHMLDAFLISSWDGAVRALVWIMVFTAMVGVSIFIKDALLGQYLEQGMVRLRRKTVAALDDARLLWMDSRHTGELSARVMADLNALGGALRPVLIMGLSIAVAECVSLIFMFAADWLLTLIVLAVVPATTALQWLSSRPIRRFREENQNAVGALSSVVFDCFGSFETVKSLSLEGDMRVRFAKAQALKEHAALRENGVTALLTLIAGVGRYLPYLLLILAGGSFVIAGRLTLGGMTMFLALSSGVIYVLGSMGGLIASVRQLGVNAERIADLWDMPKERAGGETCLPETYDTVLRFEDVTFAYGESGGDVLRGVTFGVPRGDFAALVGESGCGKSTAMKLAASLYEARGGTVSVLGRGIAEWELEALRSRIAYVSQDTYLFPGTLRDNILAGREDSRDGFLEECLRIARLRDFIETLPGGLDAPVGERGVFLSGGQRQRISIARALYKRADLLLLDEATSALDATTEQAIISGICAMPERPAMLFITHRLSNVMHADNIIVFSAGEIAESGAHNALMRERGIYARLLTVKGGDMAL